MTCKRCLNLPNLSCCACGRIADGMADDDLFQAAWESAKRDVARITPRQRRIFDNNDALRRLAEGE